MYMGYRYNRGGDWFEHETAGCCFDALPSKASTGTSRRPVPEGAIKCAACRLIYLNVKKAVFGRVDLNKAAEEDVKVFPLKQDRQAATKVNVIFRHICKSLRFYFPAIPAWSLCSLVDHIWTVSGPYRGHVDHQGTNTGRVIDTCAESTMMGLTGGRAMDNGDCCRYHLQAHMQ